MCENRFMTPSENCKNMFEMLCLEQRQSVAKRNVLFIVFYFHFCNYNKRKCFRQRFWENHDEPYRQENGNLT